MRYLGLDLGTKTLGIAISDKSATIASFYDSLRYDDENVLIENIKFIVEKENIKAIVLGLPKNMNGSLGARAKETIAFKDKLLNIKSSIVFNSSGVIVPSAFFLDKSLIAFSLSLIESSIPGICILLPSLSSLS